MRDCTQSRTNARQRSAPADASTMAGSGPAPPKCWRGMSGSADPVGHVVSQWIGSPTHNAILSDRALGRIGCAEVIASGTHWFACVLAAGPLPAQPVMVLPDTALPTNVAAVPRFGFVRT